MPSWLFAILTLLAAYLLGAIPFGFLLARWHGVDIFTQGSGNIGATNVGRVLGRKVGVLVFALDFTKGAGAVALAIWVGAYFDDRLWSAGFVEVGAGMAAFLGHCFPIYLKFRGGKGVATGAGVVAVLLPMPMLVGPWRLDRRSLRGAYRLARLDRRGARPAAPPIFGNRGRGIGASRAPGSV